MRLQLGITIIFSISIITFGRAQTNDSLQRNKVSVDAIEAITSVYFQNGQHSAVTGGVGSERLFDAATQIAVKLVKNGRHNATNELTINGGLDFYSSASSNQIDPAFATNASNKDLRIHPSIQYVRSNDSSTISWGSGLSYSLEYDYRSYGWNGFINRSSKNRLHQLKLNGSIYLDNWIVLYPIELKPSGYGTKAKNDKRPLSLAPRRSYTTGINYAFPITKRVKMALEGTFTYQHGLLSTPFHRFYFLNNPFAVQENLPDTRMKWPVSLRMNYFHAAQHLFKFYFRFYQDDWNINSITSQLEWNNKLTPEHSYFLSYRFHLQTAASYFYPRNHLIANQNDFFTSDYDLSNFSSHQLTFGYRKTPINTQFSIFNKIYRISTHETRLAGYLRTDGLGAVILTYQFGIKKVE